MFLSEVGKLIVELSSEVQFLISLSEKQKELIDELKENNEELKKENAFFREKIELVDGQVPSA